MNKWKGRRERLRREELKNEDRNRREERRIGRGKKNAVKRGMK